MFGLSKGASGVTDSKSRIVGLGIKDYGSTKPEKAREYLDTMASLVSWLQQQGYCVRLLIGDIQYDTPVIEEFMGVLKSRNITADQPLLIAEPALTVEELLRQVSGTEAVISARYHNLVMALIQNKPVISLSDHPKLNSVVADFGLAQYLLPLQNLTSNVLIGRFQQLENDAERLRPQINAKLETYRQALDALFATMLVDFECHVPNRGGGGARGALNSGDQNVMRAAAQREFVRNGELPRGASGFMGTAVIRRGSDSSLVSSWPA